MREDSTEKYIEAESNQARNQTHTEGEGNGRRQKRLKDRDIIIGCRLMASVFKYFKYTTIVHINNII